MNYTEFRPGFKARAATAALAVTTAFAVVSLGLAAVTSAPAQASDTSSAVRAALKARLPKTPIDALT
jgi:thiol:disulfide interchange protein DsbC